MILSSASNTLCILHSILTAILLWRARVCARAHTHTDTLPLSQFSSSLPSTQSWTPSHSHRIGIQWALFLHRNWCSLHAVTQSICANTKGTAVFINYNETVTGKTNRQLTILEIYYTVGFLLFWINEYNLYKWQWGLVYGQHKDTGICGNYCS